METYPKPTWVVPRWWISAPDGPSTTSRRALVTAWVALAEPPKPRKKEFVDEIKGWSGVLGSSKPWVERKYDPLTARLACCDSEVDEPEAWLSLSLLYAGYVDTLARFTARFAAAAHEYRPHGIPHELGDSVKCYELTVPPAVRAVMAGARTPQGLGGVVDTERSADAFVADPDAHHPAHHALAMRHYAAVLRDKLTLFQDDPDLCAAFADQITALARYGTPDSPPRAASQAEEVRVDELLSATVRADAGLRADPHLSEAYLRARKTLLRWMRDGREVTDATIVYTKLGSARLDAARAQRVIDANESSFDAMDTVSTIGALGREPLEFRSVTDATILTRARELLADYPATVPGTSIDCWEKKFALAVLGEPAATNSYLSLRAKVRAAWRGREGSGRAETDTAVSANSAAAARLVDALLFLAISSSVQSGDLTGLVTAEQLTRRRTETDDILHTVGYAIDDIEQRRR